MSIVKLNNRGVRSATAFGSITGLGSWKFLSKQTASSSSTISFTSGIDSTYKEYMFTFKNIHPSADSAEFSFQADTGTNTNYNLNMTSTFFKSYHRQDAVVTDLAYDTGEDQASGTAFSRIGFNLDASDASDNLCGYLHIFNPSNSAHVKHFLGNFNYNYDGDANEAYTVEIFNAGYFNITTPITRFQFKMESGNIDAGDICLYGLA